MNKNNKSTPTILSIVSIILCYLPVITLILMLVLSGMDISKEWFEDSTIHEILTALLLIASAIEYIVGINLVNYS